MHRVVRLGLVALGVLPFAVSCNLYKPFSSGSSVSDILEEAQACLHAADYDCAITQYSRLPDGNQKSEKLCVVNMAKAGFGLTVMMETVTNSNSSTALVGSLANDLLPFSATKLAAAEAAKENCADMTSTDDTAKLYKVLSLLVDCAIRIARTDTQQATSANPTECNITEEHTGDGVIDASDIGGNAGTGALSGGEPGMCDVDALICVENLDLAVDEDLTGSGMGFLEGNLGAIPAGVVSAGTASAARDALKDTLE